MNASEKRHFILLSLETKCKKQSHDDDQNLNVWKQIAFEILTTTKKIKKQNSFQLK
jgi:hypothetical protein